MKKTLDADIFKEIKKANKAWEKKVSSYIDEFFKQDFKGLAGIVDQKPKPGTVDSLIKEKK
jgi:hypothetical protein